MLFFIIPSIDFNYFFLVCNRQVVTLVLYSYFIAALLGRQMIPRVDGATDRKYEDPDLYFPLFTALQVTFFFNFRCFIIFRFNC